MSTPPPASPAPADIAAGKCRLTEWGLIRAQGADAASFLHGQLTQDVQHLEAGRARLAGYCSAKGRLLATLVVWRGAGDELWLACSADLLPATLKRLSMFVLRAKCKLSDASAELPLWGAAGAAAQQVLDPAAGLAVWGLAASDGTTTVRLPDAVVSGQPVPRYLLAALQAPALPAISEDHWRWLEVHSGVPRVQAATQEQFVPQMVNLELVGGVDFQKGCYPGQEVVARSHYRGTLKRRAYVLNGTQALAPGQEVYSSLDPEQPAGMVVLAGKGDGGEHAALAELKIAALQAGTLHAGAAGGPLLLPAEPPYPLPVAEAG
jgi:folate-binding protein YgfZ